MALVAQDCKVHPAFRNFDKQKTDSAYMVRFNEYMKDFKARFQISGSGANSSGLPVSVEATLSEIDSIFWTMVREQKVAGQEAENASEKNKRTQQRMLTYERAGIARQTSSVGGGGGGGSSGRSGRILSTSSSSSSSSSTVRPVARGNTMSGTSSEDRVAPIADADEGKEADFGNCLFI